MPIYTVVDDPDNPQPMQYPGITLVDADGGPYNPATSIPSGTYVPMGPAPTGVASTDTAAVQAALTAAAGGTCYLTRQGTFWINATLTKPANTSLILGEKTTLKATATIAGPLLEDDPTVASINCVLRGGTLDANNLAQNCLWLHNYQYGSTETRCINATQYDMILGDPTAASNSYAMTLGVNMCFTRFVAAVTGYAHLWLRPNATDNIIFVPQMAGHETGILIDSANNKFYGTHPVGTPSFPMVQGFAEFAGGNEFFGVTCDTMFSISHAGATGSGASSTITDAAIKSHHRGLPVTGTNVPAGSFVGTVVADTSFTLVNNLGVAVLPTGAVSALRLMGVGWNFQSPFNTDRVFGGFCELNSTAVDLDNYGATFGPGSGPVYLAGLWMLGANNSHRYISTFTGDLSRPKWTGIISQNSVATPVATQNIVPLGGGDPWVPSATGSVENMVRKGVRFDNASMLTSGREHLTSIRFDIGQVVNSISFLSGTTPASVPTNQWFTLRDSSRNLLGVTADDGVSAWAANTAKGLFISRTVTDAAIASTVGNAVLTSATAAFTTADVGKQVTVMGAGAAGVPLGTTAGRVTIASYQSATQVTLSAAAGTTVSGAIAYIATPFTIRSTDMYYLGVIVVASTVPTFQGVVSTASSTASIAPITAGVDTTNTGRTTPSTAVSPAAALTASSIDPYAFVS